jgi:HPt (histidine-containing phosphotransfer) domain-containing protein
MNPLRAQFDALLAQYRRDLPAKIGEMEGLWSAGRIAELRRALHTFSGSAGTFGLPEIGKAAAAAEECLVDEPDALQRNAFGNAFARLKKLGTTLASSD